MSYCREAAGGTGEGEYLRVDFINPFVGAAYDVLKAEVGAEPEKGQLSIQESDITANDITVIIGVVGDLQGMVSFGFSERTAKNLASAMLKQRVPIFDSLAESAIGELGNVITGRASQGLEKKGFSCKITPPTLIIGRGTIISTISFKRLVVPLETQYGQLEINVALRENESSKP